MNSKLSVWGLLLDAAAWSIAGYITVTMAGSAANGHGEYLSVAFAAIFVIPPSLVWIPVRMGPRIIALSKRALRMELATTPINLNRFLLVRLVGVALLALVPALMGAYVAGANEYWPYQEIDAEVVVASEVMVWIALLTVMGCVDWLRRLCRRNRDGWMLYIPFFWFLISMAMPILALMLFAGLESSPVFYPTLHAPILIPLFIILTVVFLSWDWKSLCREYFLFERQVRENAASSGESH